MEREEGVEGRVEWRREAKSGSFFSFSMKGVQTDWVMKMGLARAFYHKPKFAVLDGERSSSFCNREKLMRSRRRMHECGIE